MLPRGWPHRRRRCADGAARARGARLRRPRDGPRCRVRSGARSPRRTAARSRTRRRRGRTTRPACRAASSAWAKSSGRSAGTSPSSAAVRRPAGVEDCPARTAALSPAPGSSTTTTPAGRHVARTPGSEVTMTTRCAPTAATAAAIVSSAMAREMSSRSAPTAGPRRDLPCVVCLTGMTTCQGCSCPSTGDDEELDVPDACEARGGPVVGAWGGSLGGWLMLANIVPLAATLLDTTSRRGQDEPARPEGDRARSREAARRPACDTTRRIRQRGWWPQ